MTDESLTNLEMAVLVEACKQLAPDDRAAFEQQMDGIAVQRRQNTGAGFYTYFILKSKSAPRIQTDTKRCNVAANINGLENALGFIVWTRDGYVDHLEGYTMALDNTIGMNLSNLEFQLTSALAHGAIE